ncbi:DUF6804 family protein [Prolixibacter denitrificans]|uniref:Uncharacterized protein n=1 Tax=Prolixibacter denitrificans TaxID=1541063 RepID=A0A2P8CHW5_9BACT|nr:DUF6804 family protein [Prolixibacter denitrificans]PSK84502.1 hypothetical protein CLV93_102290 [Prolixibacter denitrificans]GET20675.1 hypothetical protein JCM18694_09210 [Prolixibacter denitrificans]
MRFVLLLSAALLLLSLAALPSGFYILLRIAVTIGAVAAIISEIDNGINFWVVAFAIIAILFNPLLPIYLDDKSAWMPIDIIAAVLFLVKSFTLKKAEKVS